MASHQYAPDVSDDGFSLPDMDSELHQSPVTFGFMDLPVAVDETGTVMEWSTAHLTRVEPYVESNDPRYSGGSGILDSDPATHLYIRLPTLADRPEEDYELEDQRRMYLGRNIDHLVDGDAEDVEDDDSPDTSSDYEGSQQGSASVAQASSCSSPNESPVNPFATISKTSTDEPISLDSTAQQLTVQTTASEATSAQNSDSQLLSPASTWTSDRASGGQPSDDSPSDDRLEDNTLSDDQTSNDRPSDDRFNLDQLWTDLQASMVGAVQPEEYYDAPCEYNSVSPSSLGPSREREILEEIPEPAQERPPVDVVVRFDEDSTACFYPMRANPSIFVTFPGKKTLKLKFNVAIVAKVCYNIFLSHRIRRVESSKQSFNLDWVHQNAISIMKKNPLPLEYYEAIQESTLGGYNNVDYSAISFIYNASAQLMSPTSKHCLLRFPLGGPIHKPASQSHFGTLVVEPLTNPVIVERNLTISQLVKRIYLDSKRNESARRRNWELRYGNRIPYQETSTVVPESAAQIDDWSRKEHVECPRDWDHYGVGAGMDFDLQDVEWETKTGLKKRELMALRCQSYQSWDNIDGIEMAKQALPLRTPLPETLNAVNIVPKAMHSAYHPTFAHYQLRNMLAVRDPLQVVYADGGAGKVYTSLPYNSSRTCVIDFSKPSNATPFTEPVKISTLGLSTDTLRSVVVVGGIEGEMGFRCFDAMFQDEEKDNTMKGQFEWVTKARNPGERIVNHVDVDVYAHRGQFRAVVASNDRKIRTFDIQSQTWLHPGDKSDKNADGGTNSGWLYPWPVNCTAASPDGKLRVIVGDTPDVAIINTDTGRCERLLKGHADYGFACAWSPDCKQVATANQDGIVNIYDARNWRIIRSFAAHVAGHRSLRFSPVGGGTRALLCVEPADRVTAVNAINYEEACTVEFLGEIGGADWTPEGSGLWVGNCDGVLGGMMEFERRGVGQVQGLGWRVNEEDLMEEWVPEGPEEWIDEDARWKDWRCVDPGRGGRGNGKGAGFEGDGWVED